MQHVETNRQRCSKEMIRLLINDVIKVKRDWLLIELMPYANEAHKRSRAPGATTDSIFVERSCFDKMPGRYC